MKQAQEKPKRKQPERLCVSCRQQKTKQELMRVVAFQGRIQPDPSGKAPGRGAYICRRGPCFQQALREDRLARSLHVQITSEVEEELLACWETLNQEDIESRLLNLIGLGRRAKRLICGNQAVELALRRGQAKLVFMATDAAEAGIKTIQALAKGNDIPVHFLADKEVLGRLTGQDLRAVVAIQDPDLVAGCKQLLAQLQVSANQANEQTIE